MLRNLNFFSCLAVMLASLAFSSPARALQPHVDDAGGFFDADTIAKANANIAQIKRDTGRDLMVETYTSIPEPLKAQYQQLGKDPFYLQWSYQRARELGINGVFILVTREPRHLQVLVGSVTLAKYFPEEARTQLTDLLLSAFRNNDYNGGLIQGVEFVQKTMMANAMARQNAMDQPAATGTGGSVGGWVCLGVAILAGVVLLVNFFGRRASGYPPAGYPPGAAPSGYPPGSPGGYGAGGGGGGGGFGRGLLGGLLGGAVGGWAYDRFLRGGSGGGGFSSGGVPIGGTPSDVDTTYTSSGGDFGNSGDSGASTGGDFGGTSPGDASSSGSDFGDGGASAGGDFGGGDSGGGGGGDSGGGGGGDF